MTNLFLHNFVNIKDINKIQQIIYKNKTYYQLTVKGNLNNCDKVFFETSPYKCNKCNKFFDIYKKIYVNYLYICKKKLNPYLFVKLISKLKKYHHIKSENDLIGTHTFWYVHLCIRCI